MASSKKGLGSGLGALLGGDTLAESSGKQMTLPIAKVEPKSDQPRAYFDEVALQELSDSIKQHGIIQPITVRKLDSGYYQIIAGERRWRAARMAGLTEVPVNIIEADDRLAAELALVENLQRADLNPVEEALGYRALIEEYGLTQEETARQVGKSRPAVANALRLLDLPDPVKQLLEEGRLTAGHARAILAAPGKSLQRALAQQVVDGGLSVRQTEALAKRMGQNEKEKPAKEDPYRIYRDAAAKSLSTQLGRKVNIIQGAKKGKVELEYYDDNDLNALLELLETLHAGKPSSKGGKA